uniref:Uncharacterized protein n=1 Tax=Pyxicephalus adspersus TaxID=30357 RepID=A0AAV3AFR9_PYXAD|nr:TPA: hypothetical protein GDO54_018371 [Pyxicephalus adspersus]
MQSNVKLMYMRFTHENLYANDSPPALALCRSSHKYTNMYHSRSWRLCLYRHRPYNRRLSCVLSSPMSTTVYISRHSCLLIPSPSPPHHFAFV